MFFQLLSIAGALLILVAYAALQMKRLSADTVTFQAMNMVGGALVCIVAAMAQQWGVVLLEGTWSLISAAGLVRVIRKP